MSFAKTGMKQLKYEDPELEAEVTLAKENGLTPPTKLAVDIAREQAEADQKAVIAAFFEPAVKNGKNSKAQRKARSRGVSGSSSRKDGNRFEYGFDCIDFAYESNPVKDDGDMSTDDEEEYFEYDMVVTSNVPRIHSAIMDFFANGNVEEAVTTIDNYALTRDLIIKAMEDIISLTLDYGHKHVKAASQLISGLVDAERANAESIIEAFSTMLFDIGNILIDFPNACKIFEKLLARMVFDEMLTAQDMENIRGRVSASGNKQADLICTAVLNSIKNPAVLRTMFEPVGCEEPLEVIDQQFVCILRDYAINYDKDDASLRLKELEVPHYHHSFVFQLLVFAVNKLTEPKMDLFVNLLKYMLDNGFLTDTCVHVGFQLFYDSLLDLKCDLPPVYCLAKYLTVSAETCGLINRRTSNCFLRKDSYTPLVVEARKRQQTDDDDAGIGSMSSNVSGDEDNGMKHGMNSPVSGKNDFKGIATTVSVTGN